MTKKSDLELFKQALTEGMSLRFQSEIGECAYDIAVSDRHVKAVESILNGARIRPIIWPSSRAKIAAAIIAAVMILTGCAARYGDEIREFIETIEEKCTHLQFDNRDQSPESIETEYKLTYVPAGYAEKDHIRTAFQNIYVLENESGKTLEFCQMVLNVGATFDTEHGNNEYIYVEEIKIFVVKGKGTVNYFWNDGKYALQLTSDVELSAEELGKIINGITIEE